jgi:hypothetical protein
MLAFISYAALTLLFWRVLAVAINENITKVAFPAHSFLAAQIKSGSTWDEGKSHPLYLETVSSVP